MIASLRHDAFNASAFLLLVLFWSMPPYAASALVLSILIAFNSAPISFMVFELMVGAILVNVAILSIILGLFGKPIWQE